MISIVRDSFNNPFFVIIILTIIWYLPGIIVRRVSEQKVKEAKAKAQLDAIKRLYPKDD